MKPGTGTLFGLYVAHRYRRNRVGLQLCRQLIASHPDCAIRLEVDAANTSAISLYRSLGFGDQDATSDDGSLTMVKPPGGSLAS